MEVVPDTGTGTQDIVRIYYNPVLQQCLPFSWSSVGGNANRFISIKNCYEICHPADPGFRRLTASGVRAYLVKRKPPKYCNGKKPGIPELGVPETIIPESKAAAEEEEEKPQISGDVVVRQIRNPFDPTKLLTIVQPITYIIPKGKRNIVVDKRPYRQPYGQAFGQTRGRQCLSSLQSKQTYFVANCLSIQ
ncbi:unnamed protein product [Oppiella nova]|uniref:BPTI/Kunitz inhibitor domain-containing protein n=1 Tax=Oppiella nova TaxID=334625 RepID=A0A7R9M856_9ACAR|nr:unnamed protein product [Oppiella nova]CAG2172574.1 unnamed protein product [Oppiella nova]